MTDLAPPTPGDLGGQGGAPTASPTTAAEAAVC